ncbi:MAG: hypothetical protein ABI895_26320 [Deltaproteobacteria bacterium]
MSVSSEPGEAPPSLHAEGRILNTHPVNGASAAASTDESELAEIRHDG